LKNKNPYENTLDNKILQILKSNKFGLTRKMICEQLKYTIYMYESTHQTILLHHKRTTIYDHLQRLEQNNIVERFLYRSGDIGRPKTIWKLTKRGTQLK